MTKKHMSYFNRISFGLTLTLIMLFSACGNITMPVVNEEGADSGGADTTTETDSGGGDLTAGADTFDVVEQRSTTIPASALLSNDVDPSADPPLTITSLENVVGGSAEIDGSTIVFDCSVDAGETAGFSYTVSNASGLTTVGIVSLVVAPSPAILAESDFFTLIQGEELLLLASDLISNDVDGDGTTLTVTSVSNPVGGTVSKLGGDITFTGTGLAYDVAGFDYTVENSLGVTGTGTVYIDVQPLAPIEALIFSSASEVSTVLANYQPPTMQEVFDTWARFDGNNYYENKDAFGISGNASAWQFLNSPDRVSMPLNVAPSNGFISPEALENYKLEVTLSSANADDDTIGVVIAFTRIDGVNYSLSAVRNKGGNDPRDGWAVVYHEADDGGYFSDSYMWTIDSKNVDGVSGGWSGARSRVKIERNGDLLKAYTTNWNDTDTYQASSLIEVDLSSDPRLEKFRGAMAYGYVTYSQPDSTYLDVVLSGEMDAEVVMDISTGEVWEWIDGVGWILSSRTIQDELGYIREVTNPETGDTYLIKENEIVLL